ncbi:MAG: SDR family oxidoreductase [Betaproteobacteria bacterium]|jgi:NAD(P)-dependent dehydrogenase (short-subunit alcohol dehydrogenase family)
MNPFDLSGKVAIVTGSTRGIGLSIARHLAQAGAKVVISSRKVDVCAQVAQSIRAAGGDAIAIAANIGDKAQLEKLVAETRKQCGKIDILVCNAASNPYYGPMADMPDDAFNKILQNNIVANHWLANLVLPEMAQRKDGAVIIVSSIGGMKGTSVLGAYAISKAADMQLARNLAMEWGPHNIRINCIAPGLVKTDFARALWENPEILQRYESQTPLRRIGEPDDIGAIAVFLASRAAAFVTGQTIVADGGVTIAG